MSRYKKYNKGRSNRTQQSVRDYYFSELKKVAHTGNVDPHSTFGKYVLNTVQPALKSYLHDDRYLIVEKEFTQVEQEINALIQGKPAVIKRRRDAAAAAELDVIIFNRYPVLKFIQTRWVILLILVGLSTLFLTLSILWTLSVSIIVATCLIKIMEYFKCRIERRHSDSIKTTISHMKFENDIIVKENELQSKLRAVKVRKQIAQNELERQKEVIREKVQNILSDDYTSFVLSERFYTSTDWRRVRERILKTHKNLCVKCGTRHNLSVDHILPRSKYPEKALDPANTQILCVSCNSSKGNRI